jgi:hypothetical protein
MCEKSIYNIEGTRCLQSEHLDVPRVSSGVQEYRRLEHLGVAVNWRGKLVAPHGIVDDQGNANLLDREASGV